MSIKIRLSLRGAEPAVERLVSIPSGTKLSDSAQILVTSVGWKGGEHHKFAAGSKIIPYDDEGKLTIGDICSGDFTFIYDNARRWTFKAVPEGESDYDAPRVLEFAGDCPPPMASGVADMNRILKAAADPGDPYHIQAGVWAGQAEHFDMEETNRRLAAGELAAPGFGLGGNQEEVMARLVSTLSVPKDMETVAGMTFRCPRCGGVCDGRLDTQLPQSSLAGVSHCPVVTGCPDCGSFSVFHLKNDGYHVGYAADGEWESSEFSGSMYDALRTLYEDEDRGTGNVCRLAMEQFRHRPGTNIMEGVAETYDNLDASDAEGRIACLTAMFALKYTSGTPIDPKYIGDAVAMAGSLKGAASVLALHAVSLGREEPTDADKAAEYLELGLKLTESDTEAPLTDRLHACSALADMADALKDTGSLGRVADMFGALTDGILAEDGPASSEWSAYCRLFENLSAVLFRNGMHDAAEKVIKTASSGLVDDWSDRIPASVRNVVAFRRALLFCSTDGDREQALDDLRSVRESLRSNEDNGPITIIRELTSELLVHTLDPDDEESMKCFLGVAGPVFARGSWLPGNITEGLLGMFVSVFTGRNMNIGRLQGIMMKSGISYRGKPAEFSTDDLWELPLDRLT